MADTGERGTRETPWTVDGKRNGWKRRRGGRGGSGTVFHGVRTGRGEPSPTFVHAAVSVGTVRWKVATRLCRSEPRDKRLRVSFASGAIETTARTLGLNPLLPGKGRITLLLLLLLLLLRFFRVRRFSAKRVLSSKVLSQTISIVDKRMKEVVNFIRNVSVLYWCNMIYRYLPINQN